MLSSSEPKARKPHRCKECQRTIEPGERYHIDRFVFDGAFTSHVTCAHCMVVRDWLMQECGGWVYTELGEDLHDHARGGYPMPVQRLAVSMAKRWARRDGSLRPIPEVPLTTRQLHVINTMVV